MSRIKEFALPDLGEGLTEGEILKWLVGVGDTVTLNQPIVEVETAKAAVEIPAKWAGQVTRLFHSEGELVAVGAPIIAIDTEPGTTDDKGGAASDERTAVLVGYGPRTGAATRRVRKSTPPPSTPALSVPAPPGPEPASEPGPEPASEQVHRGLSAQLVLCKPPVRKLAKDLGIGLRSLVGTGPHGSISRDDVLRAAAAAAALPSGMAGPATTPAIAHSDIRRPVGGPAGGAGREHRVPVRGVRKITAENMVASAFSAPHATEFLTVDMTRAVKALGRLRRRPEWCDVRVSPLLLVAKAVLLAVGRNPMVNSSWAGDDIVVREYVNLGIAASTDRGLIVPNIKDAERLSLRGLADALTTLTRTAKAGRTPPADLAGGTLTITNVGVFGVDSGTPILPPGESVIVALGAVRDMPWVHKGKVRARQVTTLSVSFDHRVIDGELGSRFLRDIGDFLTDPEAALLAWG